MRSWPALALLCSGCWRPATAPGEGWIAPFDGQTGVDPDATPAAIVALDAPPGWELDPDVIVVLDASVTGARVPGTLVDDGAEIRFEPADPLEAGHTWLWSVSAPVEQPRGPSFALPSLVAGTATFSTGDEIRALDAWIREENGHLCALLSRAAEPEEYAGMTLAIDGAPATASWEPVTGVADVDGSTDVPFSVACDAAAPFAGTTARLGLGGESWTFAPAIGEVDGVVRARRRYSAASIE